MKLFKRTIIVLIFIFTSNLYSQNTIFGIKSGITFNTFGGDVDHILMNVGFTLGATVDFKLNEKLYIQTGLDIEDKKVLVRSIAKSVRYSESYTPTYLMMPMRIAYKFNVTEHTKLVLTTGPYVAYGFRGKVTYELDDHAVPDELPDIQFFDRGHHNRLDYGYGGSLGVEYHRVVFDVGYDFGLANISDVSGKRKNMKSPYIALIYKFQ